MKVKALIAAGLFALAGNANALLDNSFTGNAELLLNVYDPVNNLAYSQDLGVTFDQFLAGMSDPSYALSFNLGDTSFLGDSGLTWGISAVNASFNDLATTGALSTLAAGSAQVPVDSTINANLQTRYAGLVSSLNNQNGAAGDLNYSTDTSIAGSIGEYNDGFSGVLAVDNATAVDQEMSMFFFAVFDPVTFGQGPIVESAATWVLDLTAGTLDYNPIPVPAAIWFLASGLIGLGAISRRRKA